MSHPDVEMVSGAPPSLPPRPSGPNSAEPSYNNSNLNKAARPYSSSQSHTDLYAADRARNPCGYVWYRFFNRGCAG